MALNLSCSIIIEYLTRHFGIIDSLKFGSVAQTKKINDFSRELRPIMQLGDSLIHGLHVLASKREI